VLGGGDRAQHSGWVRELASEKPNETPPRPTSGPGQAEKSVGESEAGENVTVQVDTNGYQRELLP
jgi:hypothetical protein